MSETGSIYLKIRFVLADKLFMRVFCYCIFVFSIPVSAVTMGEVGMAAGVADTDQGTTQISPKGALDTVKQTVQEYEEVQQKQIADAQTMLSPMDASAESDSKSAPSLDGQETHLMDRSEKAAKDSNPVFTESFEADNLRNLGRKSLKERLRDKGIYQDIKPVDYKTSTQVFYKRKCPSAQKNCDKGPLLTNIKSVIFDYAHTRGSFAQSQKAKNK